MALPSYLDLAGFRTRTMLNVADVDYVEQENPGFVQTRINVAISWIHGRLRKRYGKSIPFTAPYPEILLDWITRIISVDVLTKRGVNPADPQIQRYLDEGRRAIDEIKEAADSKDGLFDLPSPEEGDSNVTTGGPLGYSETSPYVWASLQRVGGASEDMFGSGSGDD